MAIDSRSHVTRCPYHKLIDECLQSRWSCARIYRHLCQTYGPGFPHLLEPEEVWTRYQIPSVKSIQRYADAWLPTAQAIPESLIAKKLNGLDVAVDTVQTLARMIPVLEERAAKALELEASMNGMLMPTTDKAVETFLEAWQKYVAHAFDLGLLRKQPISVTTVEEPGGDAERGADGELDFDAMPDEILDRIIRGEASIRYTRIEQGDRPRARRGRNPPEGGTGAGAAGESASAAD